MAELIDTRIQHSTGGQMDAVGFDANVGAVDLTRFEDGTVALEVGFEEATPDEVDEILDDMEDSEHFFDDALQTAREIVEDARDGNTAAEVDDEQDKDDENDEDEWSEGDTVHVTDDGTEIRVGDRININEAGNDYKITGRADEHTLTKSDNTDDWGVIVSTAETHIHRHGFSERVEVDE